MKYKIKIFSLLALSLSRSVFANDDEFSRPAIWRKMLSCDGGAAVLDVDVQDRGPYHTGIGRQLVIRDEGIVAYLKSRGLEENLSNEIIVNGASDGSNSGYNLYAREPGWKIVEISSLSRRNTLGLLLCNDIPALNMAQPRYRPGRNK